MKKNFTFVAILLLTCSYLPAQQFNLHELVTSKNIEVYNREMTTINEPLHQGIRLSKEEGEGIAWIKGIGFSSGTIEFDVRGENVRQHSFVGLAFHGVNDSTFDAIYLRPFQFRATEDSLLKRAVQYISLPEFTWRKLRKDSPEKYEARIDPAPDPDNWFHVKVVIAGDTISTFINGQNKASLIVKKVTKVKSGKIGFYVADTSGGDFANLVVRER